jgi:membrane protein DedA with SNARE-associated domain
MEGWLFEVLEWMQTVAPIWVYTALLFVAYLENVIPPVPGDIVIVFGGYLAGVGHVSYGLVVLVAAIGGLAGFMTVFAVGYRFGDAAMDHDRLRWLPKQRIYRARLWLHRWGYLLVGANRFLSGLRSVISLTVGAAHMNPPKTALFAGVSSLLWTLLITYAGLVLGENWAAVGDYLQRYGRFVLLALVLIAVVQIARFLWNKRSRVTREDG